jgi:hypothetical protein
MSLDGQYEPNNIFAKIIRGEIPSTRVILAKMLFGSY